ncbi:DUF3341 domain-containing protein [Membranihabitans marinus]|uniref:DUF3341 domain-containing protein n=1 Tax=Membranihabitans marinus TaxID=1227546 RepID=UPI001F428CBE|nr:DUF3341 domain-containing protein [Membranihabitans marinus]
METTNKSILFGLYNDEEIVLQALKEAKGQHLDVYDVVSPFPIHGLDPLLGIEESRLHIAGFCFGLVGTLTAFLGMSWIFTKDWPMIFGGKPYWSVPAFIPITFELTVLFASIGMVITYYAINGMGPGVTNPVLHDRLTDDKFAIAFDAGNASEDEINKFKAFLENTGADEIQMKTI